MVFQCLYPQSRPTLIHHMKNTHRNLKHLHFLFGFIMPG